MTKINWTPQSRKGFTPEQRLQLAKLDNKILRAFASSPRQLALQDERAKLEAQFAKEISQ